MSKFRSKLLFALISLIVTVLVGLGVLLGQLFKGFYLDNFNKRMEKELQYVASVMEWEGIRYSLFYPETLKRIEDKLQVNLSLLDESGDVLYDSKNRIELQNIHAIKGIINKLDKTPDVVEAKSGDKQSYYYGILLRDKHDDRAYLILNLSVSSIAEVEKKIWGLLITNFLIAFIVIIFLGIKITTQYTRPIENVAKVAIELAKGNYKARAYGSNVDETEILSKAINVLARNLQEMTSAQEMQQDRLHTLIENMGSGMILIDSRGHINLVNRSYREIFRVTDEEYLNSLYYEAFDHKEVIGLVEEIFMTEVKVRKQMLLPIGIERKHFEVYGAPIIGTNHEWKGIILVFHDITELKKLEQMRKDFLANVSHELRTPITSIKGFTETLLDGAMEDRKFREHFLSIILKESDRMQSLIEDLLDLSRIEQQGFQMNMAKVDVKQLIEEIAVILQAKAVDKEMNLRVMIPTSITVMGDAHRLKQIFINLINNAILYTPSGGTIEVSATEEKNRVRICVSDTGIGISEEEIPRIFERFYRIDKARSRNTGGTGLGLSIVKHLVEAHNGEITVQSTPGKGTMFTIILKK
ncbi:ATP-binding protein [Ectobacillus antri]|jgi:two-component system phosphate regulon sensor histidine kinase PhoR|uniref:histidine kinase n=1 Tax=Ectobacillus antri TaxID=2486280 RepID=A0ABT6H5B3_9BACI|nr:ATP-binding protein [Ectobacillus antri]MDG4656541.1 ATP-binding protein [Ectobacillus antri]MDG5753591.1 ATP-binding protein [Ectobacillus antri]